MAVTVVTLNPSLVRGTTARFNGELTDMNGQAAIDCYFQYKTAGAGSWSDTSANKEELTAVGEFSYEITGLTENESYEVRAVAEWDDGTLQNAYGDTETFNAYWVREGGQEDFERGILSGVQLITHQVLAVFKTTGSHSWTVPAGISEVDVLVVAGGGGGGGASSSTSTGAGGGGAGGLRFFESHSVTPDASITVVVGAGGTGGTSHSDDGENGGVSSFDGQEAAGGGGGARRYGTDDIDGLDGGCGGGASRRGTGGEGNTPSTTPAQGKDGFNQYYGNAGGGGGHGEGGPSPGQATGGEGSYFGNYFGDWFGEDGWFAGGGAGGGPDGYLGGKGGGGKGGVENANGGSGLANTGGGGGGADHGSGSPTGSGGSGIVIIAVPFDNVRLGGEGTRQKPYKITNTGSEITWTATTPTDTTLAIEAQVQGATAITDEAVGTGDGVQTVFTLDHWPADTPAIKVDGVAETGFTLGDDRRTITFDTAPADTHAILASYTAVDDPQEDDPEIQTLDLDSPTGGTFKLGDGTTWTADIAYNASAADIETALEGLYGAGNVEVKDLREVYALEFDGIDDRVDLYSMPSFANITVEFWIKPLSDMHNSSCWLGNSTDTTGWMLYRRNSVAVASGGEWAAYAHFSFPPLDVWTHLAFTYDSTVLILYENGQYVSEDRNGGGAISTSSIIARINNSSSSWFDEYANMQMNDLRIWDTVRTQTQINENKNKFMRGDETGLLNHWLMNEGSGTLLSDNAGSNDGTIVGATWKLLISGENKYSITFAFSVGNSGLVADFTGLT